MWIKQFLFVSLGLTLSGCCAAGVDTYYSCQISLPEPFNPRTQHHELFKGLNAQWAKDSRSPQELAQELARKICYAHLGQNQHEAGAPATTHPGAAQAWIISQGALRLTQTLGFERCTQQVLELPHTCQTHKTINPLKNLEFNPKLH